MLEKTQKAILDGEVGKELIDFKKKRNLCGNKVLWGMQPKL